MSSSSARPMPIKWKTIAVDGRAARGRLRANVAPRRIGHFHDTIINTRDNTIINKRHQHARIVDRILNTSTFYATSTAAGVGAPVASAAAFSAATFARRSSS